jgi:hypothetical protein
MRPLTIKDFKRINSYKKMEKINDSYNKI